LFGVRGSGCGVRGSGFGQAADQFYTVIAGSEVRDIAAHLDTIASANATLAAYHRQRRATLATA